MKLIANETKYARRCLEQNYIDKKQPYKSIRTVVRYLYKVCGIHDIDMIYSTVQSYIESTGKDVFFDKQTIVSTLASINDDEHRYNNLESVSLSSKEMYTIMNNNYPYSWRKILFVMLVQYKVKKAIYSNSSRETIQFNYSVIFTDAHVTYSLDKKEEMFKSFERDGYVTMANGGKGALYIELNYIDEEPQDELIVIEDFFDFYLYFEQYVKGGRLIYCQECGKLVHVVKEQDYSKKYCKKCAKEIEKEKTLQRVKRHNERKMKN